MDASPVVDTSGLVYFTDGSLAYAGRHVHERAYPAHTHSFIEVAVAVGGEGTHHSPAGRARLTAGDAVLLRPGVWHEYDDCDDLVLYNCCFSPGLLQRELAWARENPVLAHLLWIGPYATGQRGMMSIRLDEASAAECVGHLRALEKLRHCTAEAFQGDVVGRLTLFLSGLARAAAGSVRPAAPPAHPAIGRAMQLLESRLADPWTLAELAQELHMVPGSLVRLFKSAVGLPPMAYLAQQRAEVAAAMLIRDDRAISQIARAVGWPDPNYFARRFKAHFGLSASTYRERFRDAPASVPGRLPTERARP